MKIEGMLMAFCQEMPVLLRLEDKLYLPLFTEIDKFNNAVKWAGIKFSKIKKITDVEEFKTCVNNYKKFSDFSLIVDPYINDSGNTVFNLILNF